jgi:hypothetical protein
MVIVGNKLDRQSSERAVSVEEGTSLAEEFGASHLEISVRPLDSPLVPLPDLIPTSDYISGQREFQSQRVIRDIDSENSDGKSIRWKRPRLRWSLWGWC